ncbi:MAG: L-asparaginase 1 [Bacteroidetes bacterium GWF2_43_63]|nr:MAG: L-asparaginase 1 [Bacteroidetes bacterium GWE2_42_42]OFY54170.1 MAG: L-asparaginase 1 [Bacteroidetes bacterium GWF2_43_63]HBG70785.1 L-asparaginase 1 [Bacteroidales bacterium]HCB61689.1 L-asparaginase 1 [Bacteroidales bacterium]HCY22065.1 L-asparaginase 1 [Bacteroidales bacterium]
MNSKKSVLLIYTGGTIGMIRRESDGSLIPLELNNMYHYLPVLESLPVKIEMLSMENIIDSSDMNPEFWKDLVEIIEINYLKYDGFVILHGSDTMAYTASVLSFMLENLNKPVILTGSQLPLGMVRSDGRENLINAIEVAASYDDDTALVPEVAICFENRIFRGNRTSKINAENFNAFISGNYPLLAEIGVKIKFNKAFIAKPSFKNLKVHKALSPRVGILKLFPGMPDAYTRPVLLQENLDVIILETFGSGNAPTTSSFVKTIHEAVSTGKTLFNVTQCKGGMVEMGKYAASLPLMNLGVVSGNDITTEAAIAKAMFLLGQGYKEKELATMLQKPLRGEMNQ